MKKLRYTELLLFLVITGNDIAAQDPVFSQFFSSPLNVNPALTANINSDWRVISNYRSQWMNDAAYVTGTVSCDSKVLQHKNALLEESNYVGVGGMLMFDRAMKGAANAAYASFDVSCSIKIADGSTIQRVGIGFALAYARRYVDFTRLNFEDQYTGFGFNTNLPTGEAALVDMKPFLSASTGLTYSIRNNYSNLDLGVAAFHVNRPVQTYLQDEHRRLEMRTVAHVNFETYVNDRTIFNTSAIYQHQGSTRYLCAGIATGYYIGEGNHNILNAGIWYWVENGLVPYIGLVYNNFQFGFTYDITISKLNQAARRPGSIELSIIYRGSREPSHNIPCPWK